MGAYSLAPEFPGDIHRENAASKSGLFLKKQFRQIDVKLQASVDTVEKLNILLVFFLIQVSDFSIGSEVKNAKIIEIFIMSFN